MQGLKIGHFSNEKQGTGVTVFLFESGAVGSYCLYGAAPATLELPTLDPENSVPYCHGLVFAGGSAYGLMSAAGVMRYIFEQGIGHPVPHGSIPIVPTVALYDMAYKTAVSPSADHAYQACLNAEEDNDESGRIGVGTGATVGKLVPNAWCMTGGLGRASVKLENGLEVIAYVAVNAVGDVRDGNRIIAGAVDDNGAFCDTEKYLLSGHAEVDLFELGNTTLAAIFTNAALDKSAAKRIARMATAGLARAISPVGTLFDGDVVFCMSVGEYDASELSVGVMAVDAVRLAILDAVRDAVVVKGSV